MVVCQHTLREGRHDQGSMLVLLQAGGLMEAAQLNCCAHIILRGDANRITCKITSLACQNPRITGRSEEKNPILIVSQEYRH